MDVEQIMIPAYDLIRYGVRIRRTPFITFARHVRLSVFGLEKANFRSAQKHTTRLIIK